jgi:hypothetical protein
MHLAPCNHNHCLAPTPTTMATTPHLPTCLAAPSALELQPPSHSPPLSYPDNDNLPGLPPHSCTAHALCRPRWHGQLVLTTAPEITKKERKKGGKKSECFHFQFLFNVLNVTTLLPCLWTAYPHNSQGTHRAIDAQTTKQKKV